ncbi:MAG: divergent polysaccharide deacetylase family protein [bacterium]
MAIKKKKKKKRSGGQRRRKQRKPSSHKIVWLSLALILLSLINLIFLDTLIGFRTGGHFLPRCIHAPVAALFSPRHPQPPYIEEERETAEAPADDRTLDELKPPRKFPLPQKVAPLRGHRVALIIDDLGYNMDLAEALLAIDVPLTVSILPNLPYTHAIARRAVERGKEVILHLPMEPYDYPNAQVEEGTLLTTMDDSQIRRLIEKSLVGLDGVVGANNHMGSRMVEDEGKMRVILEEMKKRGLFFLDSRTSPRSMVYDLARAMGVKTAKRHVFLDGRHTIAYIRRQLDKVAEVARENGCGIAIGHLHPTTLEALRAHLPRLGERGIQFVKLSEVVE